MDLEMSRNVSCQAVSTQTCFWSSLLCVHSSDHLFFPTTGPKTNKHNQTVPLDWFGYAAVPSLLTGHGITIKCSPYSTTKPLELLLTTLRAVLWCGEKEAIILGKEGPKRAI